MDAQQNPLLPNDVPLPNPLLAPSRHSNIKIILGILLLLIVVWSGAYYLSLHLPADNPNGQPTPTTEPTTTPVPENPVLSWKAYFNKTFDIVLKYPLDWFGPEVTESKDGFYWEMGSDKVYPYGTGLDERKYDLKNTYFITFQYVQKPKNTTIEQYKKDQPWILQYLPLLNLKDGEIKSDQRSKITKVQNVRIGNYKGAELINTLSETAQTDMVYNREIFLIDSSYNTIRITGSPNNVEVKNKAAWQKDYQKVDEENLTILRNFLDAIQL